MSSHLPCSFFFFFNDTATTEIYTLSLHDALPISIIFDIGRVLIRVNVAHAAGGLAEGLSQSPEEIWSALEKRSEEHTSELQSQSNLVCRLLLEKKKTKHSSPTHQRR